MPNFSKLSPVTVILALLAACGDTSTSNEANLEEGRISTSSPIAKALIGKSVGDQAEVQTPRGPHPYEILSIEIVR